MSTVRSIWAAMSGQSRALAGVGVAAAAALVVAVVMSLAGSAAPRSAGGPSAEPVDTAPPLPPTPSRRPEASPTPTPSPTPRGADPLLGADGRLTVLLLGSDYRPSHPGNRTDAIMVVSVDPTTGRAAAFSIPRDTVNFPMPDSGRYRGKVNALLNHLEQTTGHGYGGMKRAVARAFDLEVDRFVFIGFAGVRQLVAAVGGVDVTLDKAYYDPYYWVTSRKRGWGLPKGTSHLGPNDALIFARSRKGDNDFGRARRQQILVMAALEKVRKLGPTKLPQLLAIADRTVRTDLPLERANELFELFSTVDLETTRRTVFGPRTYAGTVGSSFALKLDACKEWIRKNFPPIRPLGAWPEPSAAPSPAAPSPAAPPAASPAASSSPAG